MLSKKSDDIPKPPVAQSWSSFLRANWTLPLAFLCLLPLSWVVHDSDRIDSYYQRIIMLIGVNVILAVSLQLINGISGQFSLGHAGFMAVGAFLGGYALKVRSGYMSDPGNVAVFFLSLGVLVALAGGVMLVLFYLMSRSAKIAPVMPSVLLVLFATWFLWDTARAAKLDVTPGYLIWTKLITGLSKLFLSLNESLTGPAASLSAWMPEALQAPLCFLLALLGAGCCAAVAGLLVGLPTLRLRGDYLAIATLGFGEIIRVAIINTKALGGATGMGGIPPYTRFGWMYGAVLVTIVVVWRLARSPRGRNLAAVREDEIAASAVGIDATYHRVLAFVVGAFFAGVAGMLFAAHSTYVHPMEFGFLRSVEVVVMVTLGGLGSITGAIVTAAVLTLLPEVLREPPSAWPWGVIVGVVIAAFMFHRNRRRGLITLGVVIGLCIAWEIIRGLARHYDVRLAEFRMIIYSALLIAMMLLRPQGLLGNRELWPPTVWWRMIVGERARRRGFPVSEPGESPTVE